jgi:hypothetical protein
MCGRCTIEPTARFYERFQVTNRLESWWHNIADQGVAPTPYRVRSCLAPASGRG